MASASEQQALAPPIEPNALSPNGLRQVKAHPMGSVIGSITGVFLIRIAARASYGILSTFLALRITGSATVAAVVVTVFFITELGLAPIFGNLSDRQGRKPYLVLSPIAGAAAALVFALITLLPNTNTQHQGWDRIGLIAVFVVGRLLEGISAASSTPAGLGFLADVTASNEAWRVRVMTAFEVTTVLGVVVGIPVGSLLYKAGGVHGFFGVLAMYLVAMVLLFVFMKESLVPSASAATTRKLRTKRVSAEKRCASIATCSATRACSRSFPHGWRSTRCLRPFSGFSSSCSACRHAQRVTSCVGSTMQTCVSPINCS